MSQDDLYEFLTGKLKERGLLVESLPQLLGISRSTLYRNMKGTAQMSAKVQGRLADLLALNVEERVEYERLSRLAAFDPTLVEARHILDQFVFADSFEPLVEPEPIRFALYGDDIYLRTDGQIYDQIRALATTSGASAKVHIVNCIDGAPFWSVSAFVEGLLNGSGTTTVEHLLTLPRNDYAAMVTTVTRLLPLMRSNCYTVRYTVEPGAASRTSDGSTEQEIPTTTALFDNAVSIEVQHENDVTYFLLSFLDAELSVCLTTSNRSVINFLYSNYDAVKRGYNQALVHSTNVDLLSDTIAGVAQDANLCMIKSNFPLSRALAPVLESVRARLTSGELACIYQALAGPGGDPTISLDMLLGTFDRRAQASHANRRVDVCSMAGLTEFTRTGRTSDHLDCLPSFNPSERRAMLKFIQARINDPDDPYAMYITRDDFFQDGYIVFALENVGVMINYNMADYRRGVLNNLFIANRALAEVFTDYATNHIPQVHALSREDTDSFLASLIESIGDYPESVDNLSYLK